MRGHLIFEGAELSGKSYLMSKIYPELEKENNTHNYFLDGCFWINCDIGVFGSEYGERMVDKYIEMAEILKERPVLLEKLHLSETVYKRIQGLEAPDYSRVEERLEAMGFGIILTVFEEDEGLIRKRLEDRIRLYPHYERIAQEPGFYIRQQQLFAEEAEKSRLPHLKINLREFSNEEIQPVWDWLKGDGE